MSSCPQLPARATAGRPRGGAARPGIVAPADTEGRRTRLAELGERVSVVSHELRGPLNAVLNALYLARLDVGDGDHPASAHLAMAERQLERAIAIVEQVLELGSDRSVAQFPLKIGDILAEVLEVLPPPPGVDVLRTGEFHITQVDRVQVLELFCNLVADAYDAMPHGGSLLLEASAEGGEVVVSVEDTGAGFDPGLPSGPVASFRPKLRGSGLGLAVAQQIADAHGGGLTLAETRGGGTVVTVRLPGAAPTDDAVDRGTTEQPGQR